MWDNLGLGHGPFGLLVAGQRGGEAPPSPNPSRHFLSPLLPHLWPPPLAPSPPWPPPPAPCASSPGALPCCRPRTSLLAAGLAEKEGRFPERLAGKEEEEGRGEERREGKRIREVIIALDSGFIKGGVSVPGAAPSSRPSFSHG